MKHFLVLGLLASTSLFAGVSVTVPFGGIPGGGLPQTWVVNYTSIGGNSNSTATVSFEASGWGTIVDLNPMGGFDPLVRFFDLKMTVDNTSPDPPAGVLTGLGFSTTPDAGVRDGNDVIGADPFFKVTLENNNFFKSVDYDTSTDYNQVAKSLVDFCVWNKTGGGCQGGDGGSGLTVAAPNVVVNVRIFYSASETFTFDSFYTRHQALCTVQGQTTGCGGSDVTVGTGGGGGGFVNEVVPEPSFYAMLGIGCAGLIGAVRRKQNRA